MNVLLKLLALGSILCACVTPQPVTRVNYTLIEETQRGFLLGNIRLDASLDKLYTEGADTPLQFKYLSSSYATKLIALEASSGLLKTATDIDREANGLCPYETECVLEFDIVVQPVQYFHIVEVKVIIVDLNDNTPTFPQKEITVTVEESVPPGFSISIPPALDPDSPIYSIQQYLLNSHHHLFELLPQNAASASPELKLKIRSQLDREKQSEYSVTMSAVDGGEPPKVGSARLRVKVVDVNDNQPKFTNSSYRVAVPENVPRHSAVLRVLALDADSGDNGRVVYSLSSDSAQHLGHMFAINTTTGELVSKHQLDFEHQTSYELKVLARDKGGRTNAQTATCKVYIAVLDVNDNAPQITVQNAAASGKVDVSEATKINSSVAHVSISDADSGRNGEFTCSFNDSRFYLSHVYRQEYKVTLSQQLDREKEDYVNVRMTCVDHGETALSSGITIPIAVQDENDHAPVFEQHFYKLNISENTLIGSSVLRLVATDEDIGRNAELSYSLDEEIGAKLFDIDRKTGILSVKALLDYDVAHDIVRFTALVKDQGTISRTDYATIELTLINVNDEIPIFVASRFQFQIQENNAENAYIGDVKATDKDAPPYNEFFYYIEKDTSDAAMFTIDRDTGKIYCLRRLDRERHSYIEFMAVAQDVADPTLASRAVVAVKVTDVNDNDPLIIFPNVVNDTIQIPSNLPAGSQITTVLAYDKDIGNNSRVTYSIASSSQYLPFVISTHNGKIYLNNNASPPRGHTDVYKLTVKARDSGHPPRTAAAPLTIIVNSSLVYIPTTIQRPPSSAGRGSPRENATIVIAVGCAAGLTIVILLIVLLVLLRGHSLARRNNLVYRKRDHDTRLRALNPHQVPQRVVNNNLYDQSAVTPEKNIEKPQPAYTKSHPVNQIHATYVSVSCDHLPDDPTPSPQDAPRPLKAKGCRHPPADRQWQMQHWLNASSPEKDKDSVTSADLSNADSGRGTVEEGDASEPTTLTPVKPSHGHSRHRQKSDKTRHLQVSRKNGVLYMSDRPYQHHKKPVMTSSMRQNPSKGSSFGPPLQYMSRGPLRNERSIDRDGLDAAQVHGYGERPFLPEEEEDDRTTTTSGSYVVDLNDVIVDADRGSIATSVMV